MTRRKRKQEDSAFYVPDGDAGTVYVIDHDDVDGVWSLSVWVNKQTAEQYAEWLAKTFNRFFPPYVQTVKLSTRMKDVS